MTPAATAAVALRYLRSMIGFELSESSIGRDHVPSAERRGLALDC